jgi:hypothetical protein
VCAAVHGAHAALSDARLDPILPIEQVAGAELIVLSHSCGLMGEE